MQEVVQSKFNNVYSEEAAFFLAVFGAITISMRFPSSLGKREDKCFEIFKLYS